MRNIIIYTMHNTIQVFGLSNRSIDYTLLCRNNFKDPAAVLCGKHTHRLIDSISVNNSISSGSVKSSIVYI